MGTISQFLIKLHSVCVAYRPPPKLSYRLTNGELTITKSHGMSATPSSTSSSALATAVNQQQHTQQMNPSSSSNSSSTNPLTQASHHLHHSHHSHHQHPSSGLMHLAHSIAPVKLSPSSMHLSPSGTDNSNHDPLDDSPSKLNR